VSGGSEQSVSGGSEQSVSSVLFVYPACLCHPVSL